jgi:hypothetical protein
MLNTRTDEHEYETQALEEAYESDIEQVLRSAHDKINEFRSRFEENNGNTAKVQELLDAVRKQHEEGGAIFTANLRAALMSIFRFADKAAMLDKFQTLKRQSKDRETELESQWRDRIDMIKQDAEEVKAQVRTAAAVLSRLSHCISWQLVRCDAVECAHAVVCARDRSDAQQSGGTSSVFFCALTGFLASAVNGRG